ncbi:MAG: HD domain-containing protein [Gemmatimonadota bacterium]
MNTHLDLKTLSLGSRIQDPLLVLELDQRGGDNPHTILTLGNRSGRIASAPVWASDAHRIAGVARGDVVQVIGEVSAYRERRQLKITSIRSLPKSEVPLRELLPSVGEISGYWEVLDRWRGEIRGPRLAAVLALLYDDPDFRRRYEECPASTAGHHAELGGLLKHTAEIAAIARPMAKVMKADADLVLAGVLLHDIGKLEAYRWDTAFTMTEAGALIGHVVLGLRMLERRIAEQCPPPCTEAELVMLEHLILSHHGRLEYGSPVLPMTPEAEILHYADNTSAKLTSFNDALADPENFPPGSGGVSSRRIWELDNRKVFQNRSDWGREPAAE